MRNLNYKRGTISRELISSNSRQKWRFPHLQGTPEHCYVAKMSDPTVLSIGELNVEIREALQREFRSVWVAGEVVDLSRPSSGHLYFSLKDPSGSIKGVMWRSTAQRLQFEPEDGNQVICCGDIDVYPPRGTYQLVIRKMQLQGEGRLQAELRKLREKLEAEGLFDPARKRPLPAFPKRIAVVTSPSGAAVRDFLEVVRRRWSDVSVTIVPTRVQGLDVGSEIARAIRRAAKLKPAVDAILVTRGGGSLEDLWGFNDELVVRAIYNSPVPVVSAIGHEIDVTLSDLVADRRALTPTEAGELLVPDAGEWNAQLTAAEQHLNRLLRTRFDRAHEQLRSLADRRVLQDPYYRIRESERMLDELQQRSNRAVKYQIERGVARVAQCASQLENLSPLNVLARGYSITQNAAGKIVRSVADVSVDDEVLIRLPDGTVAANVRETSRSDDE